MGPDPDLNHKSRKKTGQQKREVKGKGAYTDWVFEGKRSRRRIRKRIFSTEKDSKNCKRKSEKEALSSNPQEKKSERIGEWTRRGQSKPFADPEKKRKGNWLSTVSGITEKGGRRCPQKIQGEHQNVSQKGLKGEGRFSEEGEEEGFFVTS